MCGIFGMFGNFRNEEVSQKLQRMARIMKHRGPDDEGFHAEPNKGVGIGMTRLSIVDRKCGHQPIYNEDRSLVVVLNGEIYNYVELRDELIAKGHRFTTHSDTEVLVHLYEEEGPDMCIRLNGMFAFALYNRKKNELFIARDRYGIKHLLYSLHRGFSFSSELKGFFVFDDFPMDLDEQAVSDYFSLWYVPVPRCIVKSARKLTQGHWMRVKSPSDIEIKPYWQPQYNPRASVEESPLREEFLSHLHNSVRRQLQGEVPIGVFLSGGLDSGGIVAMLAEKGAAPFHTFSVGFDHQSYDETPLIKATVNKFKTNHHHLTVRGEDILSIIQEVTYYQDQPLGMVSFPYYLLCKEAKKYVTVVLSGEGGDEIFAGYDTYCGYKYLNLYRHIPVGIRGVVKKSLFSLMPHTFLKRGLDLQLRKFIEASEYNAERAHVSWREIFIPEDKRKLLRFSSSVDMEPYHAFKPYIEDTNITEMVNRLLYADFAIFLPEATLALADRIGMAHSLEFRVPYLDNEMVDFAANLPLNWKIRGLTPKYISRRMLRGVLPDEVVKAPKLGFTPPVAYWFLGPLREYLTELLSPASLKSVGIFNTKYVQQILQDHLSKKRNYARHLMVLFNFMNWYSIFKERKYANLM